MKNILFALILSECFGFIINVDEFARFKTPNITSILTENLTIEWILCKNGYRRAIHVRDYNNMDYIQCLYVWPSVEINKGHKK